jgi:hypothetical protein
VVFVVELFYFLALMRHIHKKHLFPIGLFAVVLLITLFFGLKPKGYRFINQVAVHPSDSTLVFTNIGMVYSEKTLGEIGISDAMTIVMRLKPRRTVRRLSRILTIINNERKEIFAINQWIDGVEIVFWDNVGKHQKKAWLSNALSTGTFHTVAVAINRETLWLTADNTKGTGTFRPIRLPPDLFGNSRISLGLAANGSNPWRGSISSLMVFAEAMQNDAIATMIQPSNGNEILPPVGGTPPAARFVFTGSANGRIYDQSGNRWDMVLPFTPKLFDYSILEFRSDFHRLNKWLIIDFIVNFFGFLPFGGSCFFVLQQLFPKKRALLYTIFSGVILSLGIELWQVFIPTRTSQLLDVVLNGTGAWAGAWGVSMLQKTFFHNEQAITTGE